MIFIQNGGTRNPMMNQTFTSVGGKSTMNLERGRNDSQINFQFASPDQKGLKSERNFATLPDQFMVKNIFENAESQQNLASTFMHHQRQPSKLEHAGTSSHFSLTPRRDNDIIVDLNNSQLMTINEKIKRAKSSHGYGANQRH